MYFLVFEILCPKRVYFNQWPKRGIFTEIHSSQKLSIIWLKIEENVYFGFSSRFILVSLDWRLLLVQILTENWTLQRNTLNFCDMKILLNSTPYSCFSSHALSETSEHVFAIQNEYYSRNRTLGIRGMFGIFIDVCQTFFS